MHCQEKAAETLDELLETALAPKTDAVKRRGAAMGVGATVKGPAAALPPPVIMSCTLLQALASKQSGNTTS